MPDARTAFYAWRGVMRKRQSTDEAALEHAITFEAFISGYSRGVRDRLALEAEVGFALATINRFSDLLEMLAREREAVLLVGSEEQEEARA
jgi:hypothetical protein